MTDVNDRERDSDSNVLLYDAEIAPRCTSTSLRAQLKQRDYPVFDWHLHLEFSQASSFAFTFSFRFILPLDRTFIQTDNKLQRKEDNKLQREEVCCGGKAFLSYGKDVFFDIVVFKEEAASARRTWRIYCQVLAVAPGYLSCCRPSRLIACPMVKFSAFYLNGFVHFADIFLY